MTDNNMRNWQTRSRSFHIFCLQVQIIFVFCLYSSVSATVDKVQVQVGDSANFTWKYEVKSKINVFMLMLYKVDKILIARKDPGGEAMISPRTPSEYLGRITFNVDEKARIARFVLKNVRSEDDGISLTFEIDTKTALQATKKFLEIVAKPEFKQSGPSTVTRKEGERVVLQCSAKGKPSPHITWINKNTGLELSTATSQNLLIFGSVNRTNGGEYTCRAFNIAGDISYNVKLIVDYLPVIDNRRSSGNLYSFVNNPSPVLLKCFADGHPAPSFYWKNNFGTIISNNSTYSLEKPVDAQLDVTYQCFAKNKIGTSKPHEVEVKRIDKPGAVAASILSKEARSMVIQWNLPSDVGGGKLMEIIFRFTDPNGAGKTIKRPIFPRNTTINDLMPYHLYEYAITVKNVLLESQPFVLKVRTLQAAPSPPTNFHNGNLPPSKERQLLVLWSPPAERNGIIRNYEIAYGPRSDYNAVTAKKQLLSENASFVLLTSLKPYHEYSIQVRAVTIEPGPWTAVLNMKTAHEAPSAPRNILVHVLDAHKIQISWKSPIDIYGPISTVEAKMTFLVDGKWLKQTELFWQNPEQRYRIIGSSNKLKANTDYKIQIREATGLERKWGPYSDVVSFKTPQGTPSVPKDLKITHRTTSSISLSWQRPSVINGLLTHFIIYYKNSTHQLQEKVKKDLWNQTFRHELINLKSSTKYTVMVQAFTIAGGGFRTKPIEISTYSPPVAKPRSQREIPAGPIIGGIFSFIVILVLLIILILFIARKQKLRKKAAGMLDNQPFDLNASPEARLLTPAAEEKIPDVVTTNGNTVQSTESSIEGRKVSARTFLSSRPIKLSELKEVCDRLHKNKDTGFIQEFKSIKRETDVSWEISDRAENKCKNRYVNIVAYDQTRVILSYIENIPGSDYINANYIDGYDKKKKFIATQGPVAASFSDFWRMVWEQNSHIIVMVTNLIEKSRIKCQKYWPTGDPQQYGSIAVTPEEEIELADYVIRQFSVTMLTGKEKHHARKVTQYQFTGWPDHGVPQYATGLLQFLKRVRSASAESLGPIICHCSAGVGRTGTYITLDTMLSQMKDECNVDIHGCVSHMRTQRNYMVQTEGQYAFIYDALLEAAICGETEISVKDLPARIRELQQHNPETNKAVLQDEFERLSYNLEENHIYEAGLFPVNANKNRSPSILPIESTRLKLWPYPEVEGSDYINANFVDGYQQREAFILTQAPLENTVEDFWRMIWEYEVFSIVMLTSTEESNALHCFPYWPINTEPATVGLLLVQIAAEEDRPGYVKREFRVTNSKTGETRVVTHFMFYDWPEKTSPIDPTLVIDMIGQLQKTQQMTGNGSIVVHCSDGCGRSGSLCAIICCIERLKLEGVVDVFQTVRLMRTQRPQIIRELDHYLFCYNVVKKFVDKFSDYANFK